jgi:hypothetical protein
MHSLSIYQSTPDLEDNTLNDYVSQGNSIILSGKRGAVELTRIISNVEDHLLNMPLKIRKEKRAIIIACFGMKNANWKKAREIGKYVNSLPNRKDEFNSMPLYMIESEMRPPKQLAAPAPKLPKVDKDQMIKDHEKRIRDLEQEVKELKNEVDYRKEEVGDLRGWLDTNYKAGGSAGVYKKLGRTIH